MKNFIFAKAGSILNFSEGEYEDYRVVASMIVIKDIWADDILKIQKEAMTKFQEDFVPRYDGQTFEDPIEEHIKAFSKMFQQSEFVEVPAERTLWLGAYEGLQLNLEHYEWVARMKRENE